MQSECVKVFLYVFVACSTVLKDKRNHYYCHRRITRVAQARKHFLTFEGTATDSESTLYSTFVYASFAATRGVHSIATGCKWRDLRHASRRRWWQRLQKGLRETNRSFLSASQYNVRSIELPASRAEGWRNSRQFPHTSEGLFIWARFSRSRLISKSFVKFSMCSYERAAWLGYRDLGFSNRDLGKWAGKFCQMNTSSWLPGWILCNSACVKW